MKGALHDLSRREVLGLAAAGTVAAAASGVAAYEITSLVAGRALAPPAPQPGQWPNALTGSRVRAAHLLRRAGIGYSSAELDAASAMAYADLVDAVVSQEPEAMTPPRDITNPDQVVQAWYSHMATTSRRFPERMTLFWHGLLTSSLRSAARQPLVYQQLEMLRTKGLGDLRSLLLALTFDPLMIRYLDLEASTAAAPNENYSRELMELFTLGPGNYTETDVREGARALSGIRNQLVDSGGAPVSLGTFRGMTPQQLAQALVQLFAAGARYRGVLVPRQHDSGTKTYLGRTGNLGPDDVIDTILAQPACAQHIATKALTRFCTPSPSATLVNSVATPFRTSGYQIRTLMRTIFMSDEFVSAASYRSLVRSPAEYLVAIMRALNRPALAAAAVRQGPPMGQRLYDPPNVGGWPGGPAWITSSAWLARVNVASGVVAMRARLPDPAQAVRDQLDGVLSDATRTVYTAAHDDASRWYALLAGPEFHLQ